MMTIGGANSGNTSSRAFIDAGTPNARTSTANAITAKRCFNDQATRDDNMAFSKDSPRQEIEATLSPCYNRASQSSISLRNSSDKSTWAPLVTTRSKLATQPLLET